MECQNYALFYELIYFLDFPRAYIMSSVQHLNLRKGLIVRNGTKMTLTSSSLINSYYDIFMN